MEGRQEGRKARHGNRMKKEREKEKEEGVNDLLATTDNIASRVYIWRHERRARERTGRRRRKGGLSTGSICEIRSDPCDAA